MDKNARASLFFVLLAFIFAAVITFFMLVPKKEHFISVSSGETYPSVYKTAAYTSPAMIDDIFKLKAITMDDRDDLLHMKRCYQFPDAKVNSIKTGLPQFYSQVSAVEGGVYNVSFDMLSCSFKDVQSRIICELQKFHEKFLCNSTKNLSCTTFESSITNVDSWNPNQKCPFPRPAAESDITITCSTKIEGPVYALIFQSPYYRNAQNQNMPIQFTIDKYGYLPYNTDKPVPDENAPIYYYVNLVFSRYNKNGKLAPVDYMRDRYIPLLDSFAFSKDKACYINAKNNPNPGMPVGCASTDTPYKATCLGPRNPLSPNADERNTESSYGILYEINPEYSIIKDIMNDEPIACTGEPPGCGKFSASKYIQAYPEVASSGKTAIQHYATQGINEGKLGFIDGKNCGGVWNGSGYLNTHIDVKNARVDPKSHFNSYGWKENRTICLTGYR